MQIPLLFCSSCIFCYLPLCFGQAGTLKREGDEQLPTTLVRLQWCKGGREVQAGARGGLLQQCHASSQRGDSGVSAKHAPRPLAGRQRGTWVGGLWVEYTLSLAHKGCSAREDMSRDRERHSGGTGHVSSPANQAGARLVSSGLVRVRVRAFGGTPAVVRVWRE